MVPLPVPLQSRFETGDVTVHFQVRKAVAGAAAAAFDLEMAASCCVNDLMEALVGTAQGSQGQLLPYFFDVFVDEMVIGIMIEKCHDDS